MKVVGAIPKNGMYITLIFKSVILCETQPQPTQTPPRKDNPPKKKAKRNKQQQQQRRQQQQHHRPIPETPNGTNGTRGPIVQTRSPTARWQEYILGSCLPWSKFPCLGRIQPTVSLADVWSDAETKRNEFPDVERSSGKE